MITGWWAKFLIVFQLVHYTCIHLLIDTPSCICVIQLKICTGPDHYHDVHVMCVSYFLWRLYFSTVEDLERNNGRDKPYFMSKKLMKLLNAKNVKHGTDGTDGNDAVQMESLETVNA